MPSMYCGTPFPVLLDPIMNPAPLPDPGAIAQQVSEYLTFFLYGSVTASAVMMRVSL